MATATGIMAARAGAEGSRTVHGFAAALGLALLAALAGCLIYLTEKQVSPHAGGGFARNPLELMVRCLGLSHFLVGWLFLFTSPRVRSPRALGRLLLGTLAGAGLCVLFACLGSMRNPFLYLLFYGSFLFHEVRDEAVIYRQTEGVPASERLDRLSLAVALFFLTLLAAGDAVFLTCLAHRPRSAAGLWLVTGALAVSCAWSGQRFVHAVRGEVTQFLAEHRPLVVVYGCLLVILALTAPLGSIGFIVLLHVAGWLVFVHGRLCGRPGAPVRRLWPWLRSTPAGFLTLHLGLAVVLLALMATRIHVWRRAGFLSEALAAGSFCYWALMHICMSLWSPR
jgi:hypothetical protein